jgi:hypothetical protein
LSATPAATDGSRSSWRYCLEAVAGTEVLLDEKDVLAGDRIDERVKQLIRRCDELAVVFSSATAHSDWVKTEIGAAWIPEKRIVVLLDKLTPRDVPATLDQHKMIDLNEMEAYLRALASGVRRT